MKFIVLALLLVATRAAAWCTLPPPAVPASGPPVQLAFGAPMCLPPVAGVVGTGRGYLQRDFPALPGATARGGSAWGWWCQAPDQTWRPQTVACLDKYCPGDALRAVAAAVAYSSPLAALQASLEAYSVKVTDWSETHDYNCLHSNMVAALQATKPASGLPPVWRTPPGGSAVYPVAGTRIGVPLAGRRAAGNAACDLARFKYTAGAYTYGTLASGPATEAVLCVQAPL